MESKKSIGRPLVVIANCRVGPGWATGISIEGAPSVLVSDTLLESDIGVEMTGVGVSRFERVEHVKPDAVEVLSLIDSIRRANLDNV